jgi:replicative DNA helicase
MEIIDINDANRAFESLPILLDDTPGMTIEDIRIRCMKEKLARGLDLVFVDYLQLIDPLKPGRSRQEEVAEASKGLLSIARELAIPVLAAAQIGRGPEQERRAPRLSDLRESGRIEQDAHTVMMLQRVKDPDTGQETPQTKVHIRKQRDFELATIDFVFRGEVMTFERDYQALPPFGGGNF